MKFIKYIFIFSLFSPAIVFSEESVNLCSSSFVSAEIKLEKDLQAIRNSPQEPLLVKQGFKPSYYAGVDQAREVNRLHEYLREIQADPKRTHIPYFAEQVEKTISDFERGLRAQNITGDPILYQGIILSIKDPKFLEKRLKILDDFKEEARRRVENQDVTYDWWVKFNTKLSILASSEVFPHILVSRYTTSVGRVKMSVEIEYNKKLAQVINKVMNSSSETERQSQDFQNLKKRFENLNPEELFSGGNYTSQELESMLSKLISMLDKIDGENKVETLFNRIGKAQVEIVKEDDWYDIDVLQIKEGIEELISNGIQSPLYLFGKEKFEISFTHSLSKEFPEKMLFFTTDELGIMAFNKLGKNSHFAGVFGELENVVDGVRMSSFDYLRHDVAHAEFSVELPKGVFRVNNISNKSDREKFELASFIYRHEGGGFSNDHSQYALKNMMIRGGRLSGGELRWFDPNDLRWLLPYGVNVTDKSAVQSFLRKSATVFGEILSGDYLHHDIDHSSIALDTSIENLSEEVFERVGNILNISDRRQAELALFIHRHEGGGGSNLDNHSLPALEEMMINDADAVIGLGFEDR